MLDRLKESKHPFAASLVATLRGRLTLLFAAYMLGASLVGLGVFIPFRPARFLIAAGIGLSLLALFEFHRWFRDGESNQNLIPVLGVIGNVGAYLVLLLAIAISSGALALLGSWFWGLGLSATTVGVGRLCKERPMVWSLAGLATLVVSGALGTLMRPTNWAFLMALFLGMLGLAVTSLGLITLAAAKPRLWAVAGISVIAASALNIVLLVAFGIPRVALLPNLLLIAAGFLPLSRAAPHLVKESRRWRIATWFLLGTGIGAVVTVAFSRADWPLAWAVGSILLTFLIAISFLTEQVELAVILLLGAVFAGVLIDRSDPAPISASQDPTGRLVVFGDSYISGEGATRYFPGTNVVGEDEECRRASTAYPYVVASELGYQLDSYACSGAVTYEVVAGAAGSLSSPTNTQLEQFLKAEESDTNPRLPITAVLISAGGNDSWFGTLGQACFGPGTCDVHRNTLLRHVSTIGSRIGNVYAGIKEAVGEDVPIVAMPYPLILTEIGCDESPLTRQEQAFLFEFTEVLNDQIRVEAARAGINWFSPGVTAFDGSRICESTDIAVNVFDISPKEGAFSDRILPTNWFHGSAHPNEEGHKLTAKALETWLSDLVGGISTNSGVNANPAPSVARPRITPPASTRISTRSIRFLEKADCPTESLPISVAVEPAVLGTEHSLEGLEPGSIVCHSQSDGSWQTSAQIDQSGNILIPAWDREVALDIDKNDGNRQTLIYQRRSSDQWRVAVYMYCTLDPDCADNAEEIRVWMVSQIMGTVDGATVPVLLMFLGSWFLAVDIKRSDTLDIAQSSTGTLKPS